MQGCLCINVALCATALQCICRVIRRSSMTMKAHTYYIIFGRPPIGGKLPPSPWRRHWQHPSSDRNLISQQSSMPAVLPILKIRRRSVAYVSRKSGSKNCKNRKHFRQLGIQGHYNVAIRQITHDFLFDFQSNYMPISCRFWDIPWRKKVWIQSIKIGCHDNLPRVIEK